MPYDLFDPSSIESWLSFGDMHAISEYYCVHNLVHKNCTNIVMDEIERSNTVDSCYGIDLTWIEFDGFQSVAWI